MAICFKREDIPLPYLLLRKSLVLPFRPPCTEGGGGIPVVEVRPWDYHVVVGAAGVGTVYLLQDQYRIHGSTYPPPLQPSIGNATDTAVLEKKTLYSTSGGGASVHCGTLIHP